MPRLHRSIKHAVPERLLQLRQERIQSEVNKRLLDPAYDELALQRLDVTNIKWTVAKNVNGCSLVIAVLRWDTGALETHRWRVPRSIQPSYEGGRDPVPVVYVPLARWVSPDYAPGARAGSGRQSSGSGDPRSRSRPEIGRAYSSRGRNARSS